MPRFQQLPSAALPGRPLSSLLARLGLAVAIVASLLAVACGSGSTSGGSAGELVVAAAADLQFAFQEIGPLFEAETGAKVTFTFASSGLLANQIASGAPVDVFSAANVDYVEELRQGGHIIDDTVVVYALGRLALVGSRKAGLSPQSLEDLRRPQVKQVAIANPQHAPYGVAAEQALRRAGLWDEVQPKLVYGENVRQTLQYVQSGDADMGLVALSLANVPEVSYIVIDPGLHEPIRQAAGVVSSTSNEGLARSFLEFLQTPQAQSILVKYGFSVPKEE